MTKRKIIAIVSIAAFMIVSIVGVSLAYFTDTDQATNVFTTGKVDIELKEVFDESNAKLIPAVINGETIYNAVVKEITVKNVGTEEAYVRVQIAIPKVLDEKLTKVHGSGDSYKWTWPTAPSTTATIDGIEYNVYVVTYTDKLATGAETADKALEKVYLNSDATNEDVDAIKEALGGDKMNIYVVAEGCQAAGFSDAATALSTSFPNAFDWSTFVTTNTEDPPQS